MCVCVKGKKNTQKQMDKDHYYSKKATTSIHLIPPPPQKKNRIRILRSNSIKRKISLI